MFPDFAVLGCYLKALLKALVPTKLRKAPAAPPITRWPIVARYDVMGRPALVLANPAGGEVALDYGDYHGPEEPKTPQVPAEWVRVFGVEITDPEFHGMLLARRFRDQAPFVFAGADGTALIYTKKTVLTRIGGEWKRGFHLDVEEMRQLRKVGKGVETIIAESQAALRHPSLKKESEKIGPRTRILATGLGRTIVMDETGARSHVGGTWVPGIRFPRDVVDAMRSIVGAAEQKRHLRFLELCDSIGPAMCARINHDVMDRCAGIDEDNLPGLKDLWFSDSEIGEANRIAAAAIARAGIAQPPGISATDAQ